MRFLRVGAFFASVHVLNARHAKPFSRLPWPAYTMLNVFTLHNAVLQLQSLARAGLHNFSLLIVSWCVATLLGLAPGRAAKST